MTARLRLYRALAALAFAAILVTPAQGVSLNLRNRCEKPITVYKSQGDQATPDEYKLDSSGSRTLDVGNTFEAGVFWAGNPDRGLAGLAEITIKPGGADFYDISLVDAYNLGIAITPLTPDGEQCKEIQCSIPNLKKFCNQQGTNNKFKPASNSTAAACSNTDGPQPATQPPCCCATPSTQAFKQACPDAYSFSKDDASSTFQCAGGSTDYDIIFCPAGESSDNGLPCPQD